MTVRLATVADLPTLQSFAEKSGFPYPSADDPLLECCLVVESDGEVLMACAARRLVELYLWTGDAPPIVKFRALEVLHREMAKELAKLNYHSAEVFLPPPIAEKFGRRLERTWGWIKGWQSWTKHF